MAQRYRTLADYFEQTGKSQRDLADRVGASVSYISKIAAGKRQPSLDLAVQIERATGVPVASMIRAEAVSA